MADKYANYNNSNNNTIGLDLRKKRHNTKTRNDTRSQKIPNFTVRGLNQVTAFKSNNLMPMGRLFVLFDTYTFH